MRGEVFFLLGEISRSQISKDLLCLNWECGFYLEGLKHRNERARKAENQRLKNISDFYSFVSFLIYKIRVFGTAGF